MTTQTRSYIAYWQDRTEADRPWIVSLEDGASTRTLSVHATEAQARAIAAREAQARGLSVQADA